MRPARVALQLFSFILIISLATGCGLGTAHTATPPTATPDPLLAVIRSAMLNIHPGDNQPLNQAEQDATNLMREQSGARAALGDQADAIFLKMDRARAAAVADLLKQAGAGSGYNPTPGQRLALTGLLKTLGVSVVSSMDVQLASMAGALGLLAASAFIMDNAPRGAAGNATLPNLEVVTTSENDVAIYLSLTPTMSGSRMEAAVEMIISVSTPIAYEETTTGTLSMELCPDAQGDVPLQFSFNSSSAVNGGGMQLGVHSNVTGHVNDEAKLTTYDLQTTSSGAVQPGQGANAGTPNQFVEANLNIHGSTTNPEDTSLTGNYTRASSQTDLQFADNITLITGVMNVVMTTIALMVAEEKWTNGYCLEITVPELGADTKTVDPGSSTPFTAHVRHKFEGAELPLPVIATLADGQVSVTPSGSRVPAPASFTFKAADQEAQSASVNLETRSKRGIAKLDLKFITGVPNWTGEGTYQKNATNSGIEVKYAYTFSITFHAMPDGTIEGTGTLKFVDWSQKGQGLVCKDSTISSLVYPPLQVTGTFAPAAAGQPGTFQLHINSQASTNTSYWICTGPGGMSLQGPPFTDLGPTMGFDIAATDGAQANGEQDLSGYGNTGSATWTLQIHTQAAP